MGSALRFLALWGVWAGGFMGLTVLMAVTTGAPGSSGNSRGVTWRGCGWPCQSAHRAVLFLLLFDSDGRCM